MAAARCPKYAETPLELLDNKDLIEKPALSQIWGPTILGSMTFLGVCFSNWFIRRPMLSGIQKHIILTAGATALGKFLEDYRDGYYAERDAVLRHYIQLHPEDFPRFERKKFSELLLPWVPIR